MTQAFNLSQFANKVNTSGQASLTTAVSGTLPVANGGTNQTTYTDGQLLIGNTTGNTLTKATLTAGTGISVTNGSGAITIASTVSSGGQYQAQIFTTPGTWTKPTSATQVKVSVVGAGGAGGPAPSPNPGNIANGGTGGVATAISPVSGPVAITVGSGGPSTGGSSSFGSLVSATGGVFGTNGVPGTAGAGTVTTGTALSYSDAGNRTDLITTRANGFVTPGVATWTPTSTQAAGANGRGSGSIGTGGAVIIEFVG